MTNKLNEHLGVKKNPFSKFSAEEELEFHNEIFYEPTFYNTLLDDLQSGTSRFILGQRGHGKSSIIHKLKSDLEKEQVLTVIIDRFDNIGLNNNKIELLNLILRELVTKYVIFLDQNKTYLKKFNGEDKELLSLFIRLFFNTITKTDYENKYEIAKKVKSKNFIIKAINWLIKPANSVIDSAIMISSSLISESLNLNQEISSNSQKEYLSSLETINTEASKSELTLISNKRQLKELLNKFNNLVKKTYYKSSVILFDKVDEFQELDQDINKIAHFTQDILTDTELLLQNDIAIAFSLWSEVKPILSKKVRFDKFKEIDISWKLKDMKPLMDKRVMYFTGNTKYFENLFENTSDMDQVIAISNKSPRDLISCMSDIYDYQSTNQESEYFESSNVSKGLIKFAKRYDYLSLYPSRTGKNKDVTSVINKILRVRKIEFNVYDVNKTYNQKTRITMKQIEQMLNYKLIEQDDRLGNKGEKIYKVLDPKIKHLISRNETQIN